MDRLFLKDIDAWTAHDLVSLIDAKIPEGTRVDYKEALPLERRSERAEAAKDVSGLANAQGGMLFWGIEEDDSEEPLPKAIKPLPAEGLLTRLENILDTTLEPRADFHARTVRAKGGFVIVMRIKPARGRPIMVQGYGQYRYFRRSGTRTIPMTGSEVAEAHAAAKHREEALDERLRGLPLRSRIFRTRSQDELKEQIANMPTPEWLPLVTVVVAAIDGPDLLISSDQMAKCRFPEDREGFRANREVLPGAPWILGALGAEQKVPDPDEPRRVLGLVSVYRVGVIEWAHRYGVPGGLPSSAFADDVHNALLYAARTLDSVGYAGRVATWIRVENADKASLGLPHPWDREILVQTPEFENLNCYREVSTDELLVDPTPTVKEAMDLIWQAFGIERCLLFDQEGNRVE